MPSYVKSGHTSTRDHGGYLGDGRFLRAGRKECAPAGGVGIGGVLEPVQANPTIIGDNCSSARVRKSSRA